MLISYDTIRIHRNANAHPGDPTCNRKRLFCRQSNWYFYWLTGIYMTRFPEACEKKCWANWKRECAHRCQWVKVAMQITLPKQKKKKRKNQQKKVVVGHRVLLFFRGRWLILSIPQTMGGKGKCFVSFRFGMGASVMSKMPGKSTHWTFGWAKVFQ